MSTGGVAIAVSLDISNAFNSLPGRVINDALDKRKFPEYLRHIIRDYLSNRSVVYRVRDGFTKRGSMCAGVPQGSVLGPLLWDVAFDPVLRLEQEEGCCTVCYADDTLIVATAAGAFDAALRANIMAARVVRCIKRLGLQVAAEKTEAFLSRQKEEASLNAADICRQHLHLHLDIYEISRDYYRQRMVVYRPL